MKISKEDALRRLNSARNIANLALAPISTVGGDTTPPTPRSAVAEQTEREAEQAEHRVIQHRASGTHPVPEPIRDLMSELVHSGSQAKTVALAFGTSPDVAERAASGRVGGMPATQERATKVQMRKLQIQDTALLKLMQSLELIDQDNLAELGPKDLANVASSLSKVSSSMDEKGIGGGLYANVVVYAPERKSEDKYKVIDV